MAQRLTLPFNKFEEQFINTPWNYFPVDLGITETQEGEFVQSVLLEMIDQHRLGDGKILFLTVTVDTPEQIEDILAWVRRAAAQLAIEIVQAVGQIPFYVQQIDWKAPPAIEDTTHG